MTITDSIVDSIQHSDEWNEKHARQTIEKLSFNDPGEVIQESPFTVVYIATGAMQDIVLKTTFGQHLMMPFGILYLFGRILADNYSEAELDALCMREGIELVN